jgi:CO/xanthine dehydrogenase FAD-binding subunit
MSINEVLSPKTVEEAKLLLYQKKNSKLLAGGTDLLLEMYKGEVNAEYLVDLSRVQGIRGIKNFEHHIILGCMTTFTDVKNSSLVNKKFSGLMDCADMMGSPQIRNRATLGGNVANAAASADVIPCFLVMDAVFHIESSKGKRLVRCTDYFTEYEKNRLKENEILTEIIINKKAGTTGFYKLGKRNALAISRLCAAVNIEIENSIIKDFKLALGAVGRYPFRVNEVETFLKEKPISNVFSCEVYTLLESKVYESIKNRTSMPFKREAVKGVYKQAVINALARTELGGELHYE